MTTFPHTNEMEKTSGVLPGEEFPASKPWRPADFYEDIKSLLVFLSNLKLVPSSWRTAIKAAVAAAEAVEADLPAFKAGKDL
jgi:hypothetical protein